MTPEGWVEFIQNQVSILKGSELEDHMISVLETCYEKLVDMEMELDGADKQAEILVLGT